MISHDERRVMPAGAFVFASLGNFTCSICAPRTMSKADVEAFAERELGDVLGGWEVVDKSKVPGFGSPTPNPCNQDADRLHWLLFDGVNAAMLGFETKK
jgi:hypothetical protein